VPHHRNFDPLEITQHNFLCYEAENTETEHQKFPP
jgi:hypothetical protein